MVYIVLFFVMNTRCHKFSFQNLPNWDELIRQVDATAKQK